MEKIDFVYSYNNVSYEFAINYMKERVDGIIVPYYYTDRGGKFTYHGPGQKVIYIMLDLNKILKGQLDLKFFIKKLSIWIINVLEKSMITAQLDGENIGIWVGNDKLRRKIASIGIKLRKWVSYHGIAVNVNPDMKFFHYIMPCGISNCRMTSIAAEGGKLFNCRQLNRVIKESFLKEFDCLLGREYEI